MKLLFRGGHVFDGNRLQRADVLVEGERIAAVGAGLLAEGARVINAEGCILSSGFTDMHTHLREPGFEGKETIATGTAAAAAGGFTTVCAMPNLDPVPDCLAALRPEMDAIKRDAVIRVLPYGALTRGERGEKPAAIAELAPFVAGYSDDGRGVQSEEMMRRVMLEVAENGRFVTAHCEVEELIPPGAVCVQGGSNFARYLGYHGYPSESEWKEVERNIRLCRETKCRLHICHASTWQTFDLVRRAKAEGLPVTCEVTPHNLTISCDDLTENSGRYKMNPPLRGASDVQAAQEALLDGTIDAIATDHAPHTAAEKAGGFAKSANGVVGLETAFAVCYTYLVLTEMITVENLLKLFTWKPRGVLREPRQYLVKGEAADLVLVDIAREHGVIPDRFLSKGRATPYEMRRLSGWPVMTVYKGEIVYERKG